MFTPSCEVKIEPQVRVTECIEIVDGTKIELVECDASTPIPLEGP
jgi:hypothetical protein